MMHGVRRIQGWDMDQVRDRFQNLHEIVAAARAKLDRNVWDYLIGGAETETTVRRNRLAIDSLALRPRILRDVNGTDTSGKFLGRKLKMPVALAPIGSIERFDKPACAAVADAAGTFGCAMFQSSVAKPDDRGDRQGRSRTALKIFQLYVRGDHAWVESDLRPRGRRRLRRALPHRRHASLQPPRARHLQALSRRLGARAGRRALPEGARLGAVRQAARRNTSCR